MSLHATCQGCGATKPLETIDLATRYWRCGVCTRDNDFTLVTDASGVVRVVSVLRKLPLAAGNTPIPRKPR